MSIVALILMAIGGIAAVVGGIWFLIVAFKEGPLWGIGVIIVPFVSLLFLIKFWSDSWKPFVLQTVGGAILGVGAALFIPTMANDLAASAIAYEDSYNEDDYGDGYDEYSEDEYDEYSDDEYGDEYAEDDAYGDDSYGEEDGEDDAGDDTAVADGDVEADDGSGDATTGDGSQDPQIADSSSPSPGSALPAASSPSASQRPATPPSRLGGSFARTSDDSSIPMEYAADYIGQRIKITKSSGNVVYCRLLDVTEDSLMIHQSIGGGMVRFTLPKDSIRRLAKDTRR